MTEKRSVWRERLTSPLSWHWAGFGLLLLVAVVLGTRFGLDWAATSSRATNAMSGKQVELKALQLQTAPLRGLDKRIDLTRDEIKDFYDKRIPANYSSIAAQTGNLAVKSGVRLSRMQYTQGAGGRDLAEISLDAGVTGQYPQIMHFINSLEKDKTFFVIRTMQLTGQQGGMVNLRLRVSTWLRPENMPSGLPKTSELSNPPAGAPAAATPTAEDGAAPTKEEGAQP
jgi:type IV pilus assembly protein PilO